jgi:hypothetical protein
MTGQRLAALFVFGCLLLNFPLLFLFNRDESLAGVPLLYAYVFAAWGALIALAAFVLRHDGD